MQISMCISILLNDGLYDVNNNYCKMSPYLMRFYLMKVFQIDKENVCITIIKLVIYNPDSNWLHNNMRILIL